jgi:thiol-disulfide isomerase/thioredoxin
MNKNRLLLVALLLLSVNFVISSKSNKVQADNPAEYAMDGETKLATGQSIPSFELTTPQGQVLKSSELKGKVLVLDFWASWCAPCKKLTGEINNLLTAYHGKSDFQMVGVNFREFNKDAALKYWSEHDYKFPMASDKDALGKAIQAGNPTILVVDKAGIVRGRWDAYTPETAEAVKKLVDSLL